jgi:hypothetical protein
MLGTIKPLKLFFVDVSGSIDPKAVQKTAKRILKEINKDVYAIRTFIIADTTQELSFEELRKLSKGKSQIYAEKGRMGAKLKPLVERIANIAYEIPSQNIIETVIISDLILNQ